MLRYLVLFFLCGSAGAQTVKTVEIEWDPVPEAASYIVKLNNVAGGEPLFFTAVEAHLVETVPVGTYELRIRSRAAEDDIYSPWSEPLSLEVVVKELKPLSPLDKAVIEASSASLQEVLFSWTPVDKVRTYGLKIWTEDPAFKPLVFSTAGTHKKLGVKTGHIYYWQVSFETSNGIVYAQSPPVFSFTLVGQKLLPVSGIDILRVGPTQTIGWKASEGAAAYHIKLSFHFLDETVFRVVNSGSFGSASWNAGKLRPGVYRVEIFATAPRRTESGPAVREFVVKPTEDELGAVVARRQDTTSGER